MDGARETGPLPYPVRSVMATTVLERFLAAPAQLHGPAQSLGDAFRCSLALLMNSTKRRLTALLPSAVIVV
jgi:hypothetical protein